MNELKETIKTPVTQDALIKSFILAWKQLFGSYPTKNQIGIVVCQANLETGHEKYCYQYNLGNIKKTKNDSYDYYMLPHTGEIINGQQVFFEPPHPATWFRAFSSLDEAVLDYLKTLNHRFHKAWSAVESGDIAQFGHMLKMQGYYTADENQYTGTLKALFNEYQKSTDFDKALKEIMDLEAVTKVEPVVDEDKTPVLPVIIVDTKENTDSNVSVVSAKKSILEQILNFILDILSIFTKKKGN